MTDDTPCEGGIHCLDLHFQGLPGVIAAYLLEDAGERILIEIGPTSTLETLIAGLDDIGVDPASISKVLVTHIHLDHAGASGSFIRRFPQAQLYVHEIGSPHMIDPERLLKSAQRIYGDQMDALWGPFEPVPEDNVHTLADGDVVSAGSRRLRAIYTPGHASHHVVYADEDAGVVFTGDVACARMQGHSYVRPPTPPPDLDLDLWKGSVERIRQIDPRVLYLTHFGPFDDVDSHLRQIEPRLDEWRELLQRDASAGHSREQLIDDLKLHVDHEIMEATNDVGVLERYELATPYFMSVDGFLRYFRKQARERESAGT